LWLKIVVGIAIVGAVIGLGVFLYYFWPTMWEWI
jgi:hypothetical protein